MHCTPIARHSYFVRNLSVLLCAGGTKGVRRRGAPRQRLKRTKCAKMHGEFGAGIPIRMVVV